MYCDEPVPHVLRDGFGASSAGLGATQVCMMVLVPYNKSHIIHSVCCLADL